MEVIKNKTLTKGEPHRVNQLNEQEFNKFQEEFISQLKQTYNTIYRK